jgi:hypothetical protein
MANPRLFKVSVSVPGSPRLASDSGADFRSIEVNLELRADESLRRRVLERLEPVVREWLEAAEIPPGGIEPALAASTEDGASELGQGFVVEANGRVRATLDVASEPYGDLLRAGELGLVRGDLKRIQLWLIPRSAGVGGATWNAFRDALPTVWSVWSSVGSAYGSYEAVQKLVRRFRRATKVLEEHGDELEATGFSPPQLVQLARLRAWTTEEFARAVGVSSSEAEALLDGLGFEPGDDQTWRPTTEQAHRVIDRLLAAASGYHAALGDIEALAGEFAEVLEQLSAVASAASTGKRPARQLVRDAVFPPAYGAYVVWGGATDEYPLYVGVAATQTIEQRWRRQHLLPRAGGSALRRTLGVDLGLVERKLNLKRDGRYYPQPVEQAITEYLRGCEVEFVVAETPEDARRIEKDLISELRPRLNVRRTTSPKPTSSASAF